MAKNYWLIKSEPSTFSFDDLKKRTGQTEGWDGVRNYQARNFMRYHMQVGDLALFYHSSCAEPGVAGIVEITKSAYPDPSSWDAKSPYFDSKSSPDNPRWFMVNVTFKSEFKNFVSLKALKENDNLKDMKVVQKGQRLSIQPVTREEFSLVSKMGGL
ncbi:MAG: EVE domain-containing protein [Verrucomicrobia bacterium CG_4_10_14_3_um_filter_43_23]|nr:MAG: EVE domain-containing protein [Verrucomicrobia bacterium CG1_02_43_26]PIP59432.1 MAG: EVE domain-containing protein [Verrucomicrobia bacterium CG22_combo_CG10-13_8_21_14_all_43_17]PIX57635.1 MAG: EVE domain-containing protein [Verrucomicrobia bacterium CG_4_10_14_3_um_filter_43_23]PIY61428.1 MAG: EVE domain-containing protein [Verrucomicrobia bacterium CG_4_10_14_0_8_um_filter_43_34]PJA43784.1 MAG: EVE domain-containing protein [Verrucomicrobia bacterium CG_4_9_14_3_um_filter_43_20]